MKKVCSGHFLHFVFSCECAAMYDDRMVRSHVRRTRDLISTALIHSSLSTALAVEYETKQAGSAGDCRSNLVVNRVYVFAKSLDFSRGGIHARC